MFARLAETPPHIPSPAVLFAGTSAPIVQMTRALDGVARADVDLLVQGETGTGKRALAEMIHHMSSRSASAFHVVSLTELTEPQANQELFGPENARGFAASGATLYLEQIETLTLRLQRQLMDEISARPGAGARIIAGCTVALEELVRIGRFRRDLFSHFSVVRLTIPPLRERREDIAAIAEGFIRRWSEDASVPPIVLGRAALEELALYPWPGNARELQQTLAVAMSACRGAELRPGGIRTALGRRPIRNAAADVYPLRQLEREYIATVLLSCNWNQALAARRLGIGRNTLKRKIRSFRLEQHEADLPPQPRTPCGAT